MFVSRDRHHFEKQQKKTASERRYRFKDFQYTNRHLIFSLYVTIAIEFSERSDWRWHGNKIEILRNKRLTRTDLSFDNFRKLPNKCAKIRNCFRWCRCCFCWWNFTVSFSLSLYVCVEWMSCDLMRFVNIQCADQLFGKHFWVAISVLLSENRHVPIIARNTH